jgi:hypothetical protein
VYGWLNKRLAKMAGLASRPHRVVSEIDRSISGVLNTIETRTGKGGRPYLDHQVQTVN